MKRASDYCMSLLHIRQTAGYLKEERDNVHYFCPGGAICRHVCDWRHFRPHPKPRRCLDRWVWQKECYNGALCSALLSFLLLTNSLITGLGGYNNPNQISSLEICYNPYLQGDPFASAAGDQINFTSGNTTLFSFPTLSYATGRLKEARLLVNQTRNAYDQGFTTYAPTWSEPCIYQGMPVATTVEKPPPTCEREICLDAEASPFIQFIFDLFNEPTRVCRTVVFFCGPAEATTFVTPGDTNEDVLLRFATQQTPAELNISNTSNVVLVASQQATRTFQQVVRDFIRRLNYASSSYDAYSVLKIYWGAAYPIDKANFLTNLRDQAGKLNKFKWGSLLLGFWYLSEAVVVKFPGLWKISIEIPQINLWAFRLCGKSPIRIQTLVQANKICNVLQKAKRVVDITVNRNLPYYQALEATYASPCNTHQGLFNPVLAQVPYFQELLSVNNTAYQCDIRVLRAFLDGHTSFRLQGFNPGLIASAVLPLVLSGYLTVLCRCISPLSVENQRMVGSEGFLKTRTQQGKKAFLHNIHTFIRCSSFFPFLFYTLLTIFLVRLISPDATAL